MSSIENFNAAVSFFNNPSNSFMNYIPKMPLQSRLAALTSQALFAQREAALPLLQSIWTIQECEGSQQEVLNSVNAIGAYLLYLTNLENLEAYFESGQETEKLSETGQEIKKLLHLQETLSEVFRLLNSLDEEKKTSFSWQNPFQKSSESTNRDDKLSLKLDHIYNNVKDNKSLSLQDVCRIMEISCRSRLLLEAESLQQTPLVKEYSQVLKNIQAEVMANCITSFLGLKEPVDLGKVEECLNYKNGDIFFSNFIINLTQYRNKNLADIKNQDLSNATARSSWGGGIYIEMLEIFGEHQKMSSPVLALISEMIHLAVATNFQINTDGFTVDLFDPSLSVTLSLSLPDTPQGRTMNGISDSCGFSLRATTALKQRASWLDVVPPNILEGGVPFILGTRQICFKLPNGATRTALASLDLSPLGDLSLEESREVMAIVREVGNKYDEDKLFGFFKNPLTDKVISKILDECKSNKSPPELSPERQKTLVEIALKFNMEITLSIFSALFSLEPDLKKSFKDYLSKIPGVNTALLDAVVEEPNVSIEKLHEVVESYDRLRFLSNSITFQQPSPIKNHQDADRPTIESARELFFNSIKSVLDSLVDGSEENFANASIETFFEELVKTL